jgi:AraC family ethanolamine operon transcriptional activator
MAPWALPKELREVSVVNMTDPTAIRGSIEVLDQDIVNLKEKRFEVKRVTVPLSECCLIFQSTNAALRTQTRIHGDFDACSILGPNAHGSLNGVKLQPYALMVAGPGASGEIIVDSGYESIALLVPPKVLGEHLISRRVKAEFAFPTEVDVWQPALEEARELFELGSQIAETAESDPAVFNDNDWARSGAQLEFMDSMFTAIESCGLGESVDTDKKGKSYSQIVQTCEEYTLKLDGRRPYLSELCNASNVSERTLQYAFHDIMGMSPLTYLHRLRLHRARDELRAAMSDSTSVTDVALNWGFWHFGEFSRAYKNCFGELPSATLRQVTGD